MIKKYRPLWAAVTITLITVLGAGAIEAASLDWQPYEQGLARAKEAGRYIVLEFYTDWCPYCEALNEETLSHPSVADYLSKNFVIIKVNSEESEDLARNYGVRGVPETVFLEPGGEPIASLPGFVPKEYFLPVLKYIHTRAYLAMSFEEFLEKEGIVID